MVILWRLWSKWSILKKWKEYNSKFEPLISLYWNLYYLGVLTPFGFQVKRMLYMLNTMFFVNMYCFIHNCLLTYSILKSYSTFLTPENCVTNKISRPLSRLQKCLELTWNKELFWVLVTISSKKICKHVVNCSLYASSSGKNINTQYK